MEVYGVHCTSRSDRIIGPYLLNENLNAQNYNQQRFNNYVEDLFLNLLCGFYFQQNGAPPHNAQINVELLNEIFALVGTSGDVY